MSSKDELQESDGRPYAFFLFRSIYTQRSERQRSGYDIHIDFDFGVAKARGTSALDGRV